jgi:hypothetical protein
MGDDNVCCFWQTCEGKYVCLRSPFRLSVLSFTTKGEEGIKWSLCGNLQLIHTAERVKDKSVVFSKMSGCLNELIVHNRKEAKFTNYGVVKTIWKHEFW